MIKFLFHIVSLCSLLILEAGSSFGRDSRQLEFDTKKRVMDRVNPILQRYCPDYCQVIDIIIEMEESLPEDFNIGFESPSNTAQAIEYEVKYVGVQLQIDQVVSKENKDRLEQLLLINLRAFGLRQEVIWKEILLPNIDSFEDSSEELREFGSQRLRRSIEAVIEKYCPDECILERIDVQGKAIKLSEADRLQATQVIKRDGIGQAFAIDQITIDITMNDTLPEEDRLKITEVFKAKTRFYSPVAFEVNLTEFPETYAEKKKKERLSLEDPYGLEKLRQMLIMFRDLAGTKEIITTKENTLKSDNMTRLESESEMKSSLESSSSSQRLDTNSETTNQSLSNEEIAAYVAGFILLLTLMGIVLMKFNQARNTAREMVAASQAPYQGSVYGGAVAVGSPSFQGGSSTGAENYGSGSSINTPVSPQQFKVVAQTQRVRDEILQMMTEQPKVARETFARFLREDGVEATAKYVHLFGHVVVFELLNDPTLQRDLYELSEYYHRSNFKFSTLEELELLEKLKIRLTASEIKVLSRKSYEKFDFLGNLDAGQIFTLIANEKPQVQSIVLTQLDRQKRSSVFDMFTGQAKILLLSELSIADAIPKEYLSNVAQALHRKVKSSPEFDTENLRSSDILLDLLEKSNLSDQKRLMQTLQRNNSETARSLKMKLVTVEILPYLKDGHLLEIVMGMERDSLLIFLAGTRDHIRDLLLRKAPEELAQSWIEDLQNFGGMDETSYKMAEIKVIGRIRSLASQGVINLLQINEMIFGSSNMVDRAFEEDDNLNLGAKVAAA